VEKHINSKHPEKVDQIKETTAFYNNYVCDPNHLTPQLNHHKTNVNTATMTMNPAMAMGMVNGPAGANLPMNRSNPVYPFVVYRPLNPVNGPAPPNMVMHPPQAFNRPPPSSSTAR
jgi:hypothetical protein